MTYSVIGEKSKPEQPVWNGPLDTIRTDTDVSFLALFCSFMFVWVLVSIYAFVAGDVLEVHDSNNFHHKEVIDVSRFLSYNLYDARYLIVGLIALSVLLQTTYIALFRYATKALLLITIFVVGLVIAIDTSFYIYYIYNGEPINVLLFMINILISIIFGLIMYAFKRTGMKMVCSVIKESCKAMFFFPSTLYFTLCQFFLHLAVFIYAVAVFEYLRAIKEPAQGYEPRNISWAENNTAFDEADEYYYEAEPVPGETPGYIYLMHTINVFCFMWASSFIAGLGRTVLTAAFATWYHVKNDSNAKVPEGTVLKCFVAITSYHSGTVAYAASLFSVVAMMDILCRYARDTLRKIYKRPVLFVSWLTVLMKFSFDALALCAIHGSPYYQSAKDSYVLLMKNPMSYLAVNTVTECVIFTGLLLVPILSIGSSMAYCSFVFEEQGISAVSVTAITIVVITSLLMSLTCFMVFRAASNTIRCCVLEDSKFNHEAEMKLYEIHVDDVSIREDNGVTVIKDDNGITVIREDK